MGFTTHSFRVAETRRVKHPIYPEIEKHHMLVRAIDLPEGIRKDANAREATGLRRMVYRDVQKSLLDTSASGNFDLKNKGIVILAESVVKRGDDMYEVKVGDGQGIVDGGHTYEIICEANKGENVPHDQYVEVQVRTGVPEGMITEISSGLNTGIAVKPHSIANLDGKFDWIKELVGDYSYASRIAWRESDEGDYDVRDLVSILEAMNVIDFENDKGLHPIASYEAINRVSRKFSEDADDHVDDITESKYYRLGPVLVEALVLFDTIRRDFRDVYNDIGGNAGKLDIVERAGKGRMWDFPFAEHLPDCEWRLTKGGLYPIFAAFRNKVAIDPETGMAHWDGGFTSVLELWAKAKEELVRQTKSAIKDYGHKPDLLGKSRGHWNNLHKTLEVYVLREKASRL
jgi:hypothetical protein